MKTFPLYFTSGYGILWIIVLLISLLTQKRIDTGTFGLVGFPFIALVYASIRKAYETPEQKEIATLRKELYELTKELDEYKNRE